MVHVHDSWISREKYHENGSYRFSNPGHKIFSKWKRDTMVSFLFLLTHPATWVSDSWLCTKDIGMWEQNDCKIFSSTKGRIWVQRSCHLGVCLPSPSLIHPQGFHPCMGAHSRIDSKVMGPIFTNSYENQPHCFRTGLECFQWSWMWA